VADPSGLREGGKTGPQWKAYSPKNWGQDQSEGLLLDPSKGTEESESDSTRKWGNGLPVKVEKGRTL